MFVIQLLMLLYAILVLVICWSLLWSEINGIPYVPSKLADIETIFRQLKLPKNTPAIDLGSGDGRVVLMATSKLGWNMTGVEINMPFTWYAKLKKYLQHQSNAHFSSANFLHIPLSEYKVIFIYGLPKMMLKLAPKLISECPKGTWIVSNTFSLPNQKERFIQGRVRAYQL